MVDLSGGVDPTWERPQWIRCRSLRLWDFQKKRQRMVPIWILLPCVGPLSVTSRLRASLAGGTAAVRQVKTSPVSSTALWRWWFLSAGRAAAGLDGQRRWDESESRRRSSLLLLGSFFLVFAATRPDWIHCQFQLHTWLPFDWQAAANLKPSLLWFFSAVQAEAPPAGQYLCTERRKRREEGVCEIWWVWRLRDSTFQPLSVCLWHINISGAPVRNNLPATRE